MELDPRTTALVAVHYQGDIVGPDGAFAGFFHQQVTERNVLAVTKDVLDAARAAGATVIYTRVAWQPDYSDLNANSPLLGIVAQSGCLKDGSPLAEIVSDVAPVQGDEVVTHKRVGGFTNSGLHELLQSRGVTTTVFAGVATNASVEGAARQASDLGYRVVVVEDACSAASPAAHQALDRVPRPARRDRRGRGRHRRADPCDGGRAGLAAPAGARMRVAAPPR